MSTFIVFQVAAKDVELKIMFTFIVLQVAVKEVDIVEIREKSCRVRWQFAEFFLTLVNIFWICFECFLAIDLISFKKKKRVMLVRSIC